MRLWKSLQACIVIVILFFSKSILSIDGDDDDNNVSITTKRRGLYSPSSITKRNDYNIADNNVVSLSNVCFMDVQKLSHEFQDGFYSCEVEWNIKVSFDLSFQLGEYCHDVLGGDDDDGGGGGVDSGDTTTSGEEDNHHGDYNDGGSDSVTTDINNTHHHQTPKECTVEYSKMDCYVKFWDKCHMAGGRTITQDVHYDCTDNGLQFSLTLYGKIDCVPDSCIDINNKKQLSQLAPAFATISHCTILSTKNIKVDKMDHDAKHKINNKSNNNDDDHISVAVGGLLDNHYDDGTNSKYTDDDVDKSSRIEYTEGPAEHDGIDVTDDAIGTRIVRLKRSTYIAIAATVFIIAIIVYYGFARFAATTMFQSADAPPPMEETEEERITTATQTAASNNVSYGSIE